MKSYKLQTKEIQEYKNSKQTKSDQTIEIDK